jgi:molybdopterin converting factor small subunit
MSVKVNIYYPHMQQFTNNQQVVNVDGNTVGECLGHLVKQFPGIEKGIFDKQGQLLNYVYLFINGKASYPTDLAMPVKDGDELAIALLLAGG